MKLYGIEIMLLFHLVGLCVMMRSGMPVFSINRVDFQERIAHIELYKDTLPDKLFPLLPLAIRPKPIAKAGIRTVSCADNSMNSVISGLFRNPSLHHSSVNGSEPRDDVRTEYRVAMMIYMWVSPSCRKLGLGDDLLSLVKAEVRRRRLGRYLLLVHDDKGSGRLIEYYSSRGFKPIFDHLEKGMVLDLGS
jgi:GNAT superfamily N-acetyltransferase